MNITQKQIQYYQNWGKTRAHKIKFILTQGILYWGLPMTTIMTLFKLNDNGFNLNKEVLFYFLIGLLVSSIIGILSAKHSFKIRDKKYFELKEKSLIE